MEYIEISHYTKRKINNIKDLRESISKLPDDYNIYCAGMSVKDLRESISKLPDDYVINCGEIFNSCLPYDDTIKVVL